MSQGFAVGMTLGLAVMAALELIRHIQRARADRAWMSAIQQAPRKKRVRRK